MATMQQPTSHQLVLLQPMMQSANQSIRCIYHQHNLPVHGE